MTTAHSSPLALAAQRRSQDTRLRAIGAMRRLDTAGETITFANVARQAGVSRSWLYRQPDLRAEIDRLRTTNTTATAAVPSAQRASAASLRNRLDATLDEIRHLKAENHQLREEVARRFGQQRAAGHTSTPVGEMSST